MKVKAVLLLACLAGLLVGIAAYGQTAELVVETGHTGAVMSVAFSPDGSVLASGSTDDTIKLWEVSSGRELRTLVGHCGGILSVAFSPDGRSLASGCEDDTIKLWDVASGRELRTLAGHTGCVASVAFSPAGRTLASGSWDHTVKLWDMASGHELRTLAGHTKPVNSVAFSRDGRVLASGSGDNTIHLWDVASGSQLRTLVSDAGVYSVAFRSDGRTLASGNADEKVQLWDTASGRELRALTADTGVISVAFSPDGRILAAVEGVEGTIQLWDVSSGKRLHSLEGHTDWVNSVAFSPDGRTMGSGSQDETIKLWDLASGRALHTLTGRVGRLTSIAISSDGRTVASGGDDRTVQEWDVVEGRKLRNLAGHKQAVSSVAFSSDGRVVASGSRDNTVKLWDAASGRELLTLAGHSKDVNSVAFSPDGHTLASGSDDHTIKLWDVTSGREVRTLAGDTDDVSSVAFSPDGRTLASADGTIQVWDVASGRRLRTGGDPKDPLDSVAFSPDGQTLAAGAYGPSVHLWDLGTGRGLHSLVGHTDEAGDFIDKVESIAFSPDSRRLVSSSEESGIEVWDVASGRELLTLADHTGAPAVVFSPDGRLVLLASEDGSVRIWDAASGNPLVALYAFGTNDWAVVDPEGRFDTNDLDGGAPLHWLVSDDPLHALPLEIFMRDYYTPRLLARVMNGETLPPVRSIAEIRNRVQPDVEVESVTASQTRPGRADVVVHAASHVGERKNGDGTVAPQESGLRDLRLFRDGQLVGYREGELKSGDFAFSGIRLPTTSKSVTFTAYAFNAERIKSATARKDYAYVPGPAAKPRAWLLQIGVNHYEASGCELHGSANDAADLSRILVARLTAKGLEVRPTVLVSTEQVNDATKAKIREALAQIAARATPDDVFFMSFSGHGYSNQKGQFYILPGDMQGSCAGLDGSMLRTAISAEELTEWLRPIDAGEMTFILDSCDSASSVESNDFKPGPMGSPGLGQLAYDKRMRILAASQPNQAARESATLERGLLSYALTELGLVEGEADWKPKDGKITVGEWLGFGADEVPRIVQSGAVKGGRGVVPNGVPEKRVSSAQTPAVFDFSKQDTFVLQP